MTGSPAEMSTGANRRWVWILLGALTLVALVRVVTYWGPLFRSGWEQIAFYDFRLWRAGIERFLETGSLYDIETPGYYLAGSHSLFKYPPTFAACLRPFAGQPQQAVGLIFFGAHLALLLATLLLILRVMRPGRSRAWLLVILFLLWQPTWEDIGDLQMEPILLFCLTFAWMQVRHAKHLGAGVPVGVAGAFKVYPWLMVIPFALERRWRSVLGVAVGAVAALLLGALILPARLTVQFFTEILPRIGGTSLAYDNLSLLANAGRAGVWLTMGAVPAERLDVMHLEAPESPGAVGPRTLGSLIFLLSAAVLLYALWRALRGGWQLASGARAPRLFGLAICLLLLFIPTSWTSYQTLLVLPFLVAVAETGRLRENRLECALLGYVALVGCTLNGYDTFYATQPALFSVARNLVPLALMMVLVRRWRNPRALPA